MSKETSRPACPFHDPDMPVPPRYQQGPITTALNLGVLQLLAGSWKGTGFNAIWRPDNRYDEPGKPLANVIRRFLELNLTSETFDFHVIPGVVPNRGLDPQRDLSLYGLHYLQRVSDADPQPDPLAGQALHIEPGLFMRVPASEDPQNTASIVRLASIPHGVSLLLQGPDPGTAITPGRPHFRPIYPIAGLPAVAPPLPANTKGLGIQPIDVPSPPAPTSTAHTAAIEGNLANDVAGSQSNGPYNLPGQQHFQEYVNNPNSLLHDAIQGQDIHGHIKIELTSSGAGSSIGNIPFLGLTNPAESASPKTNPANAYVSQASSTFWIEWVRVPGGPEPLKDLKERDPALYSIEPFWPARTFLQLQYSQVSILIFNGVFWPHVNVATLTLSAG